MNTVYHDAVSYPESFMVLLDCTVIIYYLKLHIVLNSMQFKVMDEEDLSHYRDQPDRLIDEFKKMKLAKTRAEKFSIEAKQSAQKVTCGNLSPVM